eukprot:5814642-Amphidinium_carterae.1
MSSHSDSMVDCLRAFAAVSEKHQALTWFCRVPSASNPADEPSRGSSESLSKAGAMRVGAQLPEDSFFKAAVKTCTENVGSARA